MTVYLDVAAVRVQTWIGRSATLRGRRGASRMLADHTRRATVEAWLAHRDDLRGVAWNAEGGDVDGVVTLTVPAGIDPQAVARTVLTRLRVALPRLEMSAAWADADSYVEARAAMDVRRGAGDDLVDLAPRYGNPLARFCEDCGLDGVVRGRYAIAGDAERDVCPDCEARYDTARRTTALTADRAPGAEADLAGRLAPVLGRPADDILRSFPDDALSLARATTGPDDRPGTHTALVFADGDRIGEFVGSASAAGVEKAGLATWIAEANDQAVVAGVEAVLRAHSGAGVPVAPHLVAGDDLLLSLPATLVWPFLRAYLPTFSAGLGARLSGAAVSPPTISAGVVIAHHDYPFPDVMALAEQVLRRAKGVVRGRESAVCWLDVTRDGHDVDRRPVGTTATLIDRQDDVHALAGTSASLRRHLAEAADPRGLARRVGADEVLPFLDGRAPSLPLALDLVRWWR